MNVDMQQYRFIQYYECIEPFLDLMPEFYEEFITNEFIKIINLYSEKKKKKNNVYNDFYQKL